MTALFAVLLVFTTILGCVALGVVTAYCAVTGLLAACNPNRASSGIPATLVPSQGHVSGD